VFHYWVYTDDWRDQPTEHQHRRTFSTTPTVAYLLFQDSLDLMGDDKVNCFVQKYHNQPKIDQQNKSNFTFISKLNISLACINVTTCSKAFVKILIETEEKKWTMNVYFIYQLYLLFTAMHKLAWCSFTEITFMLLYLWFYPFDCLKIIL